MRGKGVVGSMVIHFTEKILLIHNKYKKYFTEKADFSEFDIFNILCL